VLEFLVHFVLEISIHAEATEPSRQPITTLVDIIAAQQVDGLTTVLAADTEVNAHGVAALTGFGNLLLVNVER